MRRLMLVGSAALLLVAAPAFAAFDKNEMKCRATIAGNTTKLVKAGLKAVAVCHKLRDAGKVPLETDCNSLTSSAVDPRGKLAATEAKLKEGIVAKCTSLDGDVRGQYVSCPTPCRRMGLSNPLGSYADVAECLACGAKSFVSAEAGAKFGHPPVALLSRNDVTCHLGIVSALRTFDVAILKGLIKCQTAADKQGNNDTAGCTATTDPNGAITRAQEKADVAISKACATADLGHVLSCSSVSLDVLKTCLGVPRAGFGGGSTLFEALYALAPSRGAVHGVAVLGLATEEGATIRLPGIVLSLSMPGMPPAATTTNLHGEFSFASVPLGTYQLCWNTPGYVAACLPDPVTVGDDVTSIAEPVAVAPEVSPASGVIRGRVLLADGIPCPLDDPFLGAVQTALVRVTDDATAGVLGETATNTTGDFVVAGVPQTSVTVHAECAGATVDTTIPPPLDLSGFHRLDLTWLNHGPQTTDLQATMNGMPVGVVQPGDTIDVSALVHDVDSDPLAYDWRIVDPGGSLTVNGATATWTVPPREGLHELYLSAHDPFGGFDAAKLVVGCNQLPYILDAKDQALQSGVPPWSGFPTSVFLTRKGPGSTAEACTYYNVVDPACADLDCNGTPDATFSVPCKRTTLGGWWEVNGFNPLDGSGGDVVRAFYENHNDLGFGREMNCRKETNGNVACFVVNYGQGNQDPGNANLAYAHNPNCATATVAMEYSPVEMYEGVGPLVKFFVYKGRQPGSPRINGADLDGFGQKFVPNVCLNCHGGASNLAGVTLTPFQIGGGMFGWLQLFAAYFQRFTLLQNLTGPTFSSFLPFDLATFRYPSAAPQSAQEAQFKTLNQYVRASNAAAQIDDLIFGWYPGNSPTFDPTYVPFTWLAPLPAFELYTKVVAPSCRTCHTAQFFSTSFTVYSQLQTFSFYNVCSSSSKAMPHAFVTYKNFWLGGTGPAYLAGLSQTGNSCQ